ncbi:Cytochrome c1 heme lyase [Microbotryomycetes sp. JL201]|nr:Cytochrome c1 heme lyase [Microbotryomycetes sp. JL201]
MWPFTSSTSTAAPADDQQGAAPPSACPVDHATREQWLANNSNPSPPSPHAEPPLPPRTRSTQPQLSTDREVSSIPRWLPKDAAPPQAATPSATSSAETACPARSAPVSASDALSYEQSPTSQQENWVYPSPASFYSALQRKNRNPRAQDMNIVVPIHNAVNERVWQQVLDWERQALWAKGQDPDKVETKLVSFIGKPKQLSPRARWKTLIGYTAPFDRHDWIVDRPVTVPGSSEPQSQRIRYVIDFYTGRGAGLLDQPNQSSEAVDNFRPNLAFYIDCRPALDDWEGVSMRWTRWWNSWSAPSSRSASTSSRQQTSANS